MKFKIVLICTILFSSLLITSGSSFAQSETFEKIAKNAVVTAFHQPQSVVGRTLAKMLSDAPGGPVPPANLTASNLQIVLFRSYNYPNVVNGHFEVDHVVSEADFYISIPCSNKINEDSFSQAAIFLVAVKKYEVAGGEKKITTKISHPEIRN